MFNISPTTLTMGHFRWLFASSSPIWVAEIAVRGISSVFNVFRSDNQWERLYFNSAPRYATLWAKLFLPERLRSDVNPAPDMKQLDTRARKVFTRDYDEMVVEQYSTHIKVRVQHASILKNMT